MTTATTETQVLNGATKAETVQTRIEVAPEVEAWTALCALQADLPTIALDKINPHFKSKYASLAGIMTAVRPLLGKHGFSWVTTPGIGELRYSLRFRNGIEVACGAYPLPTEATPQALGSALTYARRYLVCAVLGIVADEDDDGNAATEGHTPAAPRQQAAPATTGSVTKKAELVGPCPLCIEEGLKANGGREAALFREIATGRVECNGRREDGTYANHKPIVANNDEIPF